MVQNLPLNAITLACILILVKHKLNGLIHITPDYSIIKEDRCVGNISIFLTSISQLT